ncbi:hypothetical protein CR513_37925, partial [Mucuna pruriens]
MKPFHESYNFFKDHFFRVAPSNTRTITVDQDDLEDWEEEFVEELSHLPTLSCSMLITNKGYSAKDLMALKKRASHSLAAAAAGAIIEAIPLAIA